MISYSVSACMSPSWESAGTREWTCPDNKADMPYVASHNRLTKSGELNRKKKAGRCGYCKKKLVLSNHSPENLSYSEAQDAG